MRLTHKPFLASYSVLCSVLAGVSPTGVWAQTPIDEIIVTNTRISESARAVAAQIDVVRAESALTPIHVAERLNDIAGVNIHRVSGQEHLTAIRSPVLTGGAGAGSFLYLEDGVPLRAAGFANVNGLFEAISETSERIEVFKGPGSVVYGSNAVHGLVNVISRPVEGDNIVRLLVSDADQVSVAGSIRFGQTRINSSFVHDGGFRDASGFDQQKLQIRHERELGPWSATWLTSYQNLNQETAGFVQGPDAYRDPDLQFTNPFPEAFRDASSLRTQLRLDRVIDTDKNLSITPYARWTEIEFLRHFVPGQALEENAHASLGLLTAIYGNNYVVGVDAEYTRGYLVEFQNNPSVFSFIQGEHYDYTVNSTVLAAYGRREFTLSPRTELSLGARAEYTHYAYENEIDSGVFGRFRRIDDRSDDFFTITPNLSLTHRLNARTHLYARLARGARAPQTSDLYSVQINQDPAGAKVETLDSLEAGLRTQVGVFDIDVAAYVQKKDNFFFRNANGFNVVDGKTDHMGVELSFNGRVTEYLSLDGDISWAKHTYAFTDIVNSPSSSITAGDDVDTAPRLTARMRATAHLRPHWDVSLDWRHIGRYVLDPGNTQDYPGHDVFVLRSAYDLSSALQVFGRIDNLFDVRYADRADIAFGNERYFPGRPRTVFVGLTTRF